MAVSMCPGLQNCSFVWFNAVFFGRFPHPSGFRVGLSAHTPLRLWRMRGIRYNP